jgi:hypothetical protein
MVADMELPGFILNIRLAVLVLIIPYLFYFLIWKGPAFRVIWKGPAFRAPARACG